MKTIGAARTYGPQTRRRPDLPPGNRQLPSIYRWPHEDSPEPIAKGPLGRESQLALVEAALVAADEPLTLRRLASVAGLEDAALARRLVRKIGEGGGHKNKAGAYIPLQTGSATELEHVRAMLRRRLLRALAIPLSRGLKLVPKLEAKSQT